MSLYLSTKRKEDEEKKRNRAISPRIIILKCDRHNFSDVSRLTYAIVVYLSNVDE